MVPRSLVIYDQSSACDVEGRETGVRNRGHAYEFLNLPSSSLVDFFCDALGRYLTLLPPSGDDPLADVDR